MNSNNKQQQLLPIGCYVEQIIENNGIFERVYKCPDGKRHFIQESLLFDIYIDDVA